MEKMIENNVLPFQRFPHRKFIFTFAPRGGIELDSIILLSKYEVISKTERIYGAIADDCTVRAVSVLLSMNRTE